MDQFKADAVRMNNNPTGETAVMDKAIESKVLSVDQYADQLMDDLFQGIEHSLETGEVLEEEVVASPTTVQSFANTAAAPLSVVPTEAALPETVVQPSEAAEDSSDAAATSPESAPQPDWSLRILWAAALLSCAGALALCISNWSSYKAFFQQVAGQAPATEVLATVPTTAAADAPNQAFASYIQQSLEALALQQPAATTNLAGLTNPVVATAPAVPAAPVTQTIPGGLGTAPAAIPPGTILERVYIPVYQTPQGLVPVVPGVPVPNLTANGTFLPSQTAVAPNAIAQPNAAIAAAPQPPARQAAPTASGEAVAVQPMATVEHTLVGLLELGDSSAALFEVSGVTRRFSLGERIGSSGWTLVDAKNSEAIIRRNGEIRSVFVGQTF